MGVWVYKDILGFEVTVSYKIGGRVQVGQSPTELEHVKLRQKRGKLYFLLGNSKEVQDSIEGLWVEICDQVQVLLSGVVIRLLDKMIL